MDVHVDVETVTSADALAALAPGWDDLVRAMARPSPFLLHAWLAAWWQACGDGAALQVHVARRAGRLVGALPLCTRREHGLAVTRFLGAGHSALADVLLAERQDLAVAGALAARAVAADHDFAELFGLPASSRLAQAVGGADLTLVARAAAPVLDLRRGWEAVYRERVSAKHRKAHARLLRRLAAEGDLVSDIATGPAAVAAALEDALVVHDRRWQDRAERSDFATPAGRAVAREALPALAARGVARIVILRLDGRPIAFVSFFLVAGRMVLHHTAYDPAYARWSPGLHALHDALAAAATAGAWRVEFLGGPEPYKLALADATEPLHIGLGLAGGMRGRVAVAGRRAALAARSDLARRPRLRHVWYDGLVPVRRVHRQLTRRSVARPR